MGLFDEIKVEYPLPDLQVQHETFQTKSLECFLQQYTLTKEGRLIQHEYVYEDVPESEWVISDGSQWGDIERTLSRFRYVKVGDVDTNYHGDIYFYMSTGTHGESDYVWYEYKARFTHGTVEFIQRVPDGSHVGE